MSAIPRPPLFIQFFLACLPLVLLADPALAARLETDRAEIEVGDVVTVRVVKKPLIAVITNWKATGALTLVSTDDDIAKVRALQPGTGTVSMRMNGSPNSIELTVKGPAVPPPAQPMPLPAATDNGGKEFASAGFRVDAAAPTGGRDYTAMPMPGGGEYANVVGKWKTSEGDVTLNQSGRNVTGNYTNDGGEIVGEMNGNVLEGWWIENGANERCATARNGRYYWGRIRWTFSGDKFTGVWGYCDKPPTGGGWNGERIGAAPASPAGGRDYTATPMPGGRAYTAAPVADLGAMPGRAKPVLIDDLGPYSWIEASEVQTRVVQAGRAAFRATGNNHFAHRLGIVGDYADQYRYLDFWIYLDNPAADIQLQVQVDGTWAKRWGFDAEPVYNGYGWAMEGASAGLAPGRWLRQRVDLIEQLKIAAGQAITGLAFSSDGGDVYYDSVQLLANSAPLPPPDIRPQGKRILDDDAGPYAWVDATVVQQEVVGHGRAAFRSDGNDHFTTESLGVVGDYPDQFRHIVLWLFPIGREADLQLQVQVDGVWGKRWGFDAGPAYNGYGWTMEGATANLKPGAWQEVELDLIADLHINPGQRITGLAFSSDGGDVYYDAVQLHPNPKPARKPAFKPVGKAVLEDSVEPYAWVDGTETQDYLVFHGAKAFRSNGNDHFTADLGAAGTAAGQFRALDFWAFFMGPEADMQIQVQVNGAWGKRWGYDAGPAYNGYGWTMEGASAGLPNGRWTRIRLDLLDQLRLAPGDRITGLAFSSDGGDVVYDSVHLVGADTPSPVPTPDHDSAPAVPDEVLFDNGNIGGVGNGPSQPTTFTLREARLITLVRNYHWNFGRGAPAGSIAFKDANGRVFGPWRSTGSPGQGGVPDANWTARPNEFLPPGAYTVIDSDPATWSHNDQSGYRGFSRIESRPAR